MHGLHDHFSRKESSAVSNDVTIPEHPGRKGLCSFHHRSGSKNLVAVKEIHFPLCLTIRGISFQGHFENRTSRCDSKGMESSTSRRRVTSRRAASAPLARPNTEIHLPFALWSFHRPRTERRLCNAATAPLRVVFSQTGTPRRTVEPAENIPARRRSHARACFPGLDGGSNVPAPALGWRGERAAPGSYFDVFAWI